MPTLERDGYAWLPNALPADAVAPWLAGWADAVARHAGDPALLRSAEGALYGARDLLRLWPEGVRSALTPALVAAVRAALGGWACLVRGLFFDKPPGGTWALPWHKDLTIAVREHVSPLPAGFSHPTTKAGVPHVEASEGFLADMLTARIHLDDTDADNGALQVLPGSHLTGRRLVLEGFEPRTLAAPAGCALLMRPLLAHASGQVRDGEARHRRVLHLEFAATAGLPDGLAFARAWGFT